ncbi:hypothetical protein [Haladaptatus sp. DFWS20]|uniref:hypothetical protein n=1 Tax=Haladaptatus sp. DFWS20 TaxID=3403467 RepID=UPI003EBFFA14
MTGDDESSGLEKRPSIYRRSFLHATASVVGSVGGATSVVTASNRAEDRLSDATVRPSAYVLEQGDTCLPLGMVTSDGNETVEEFYDYRSSDTSPSGWYSSYGSAQELQRNSESVLYCYDGSRGTSLVFMHGMRGGESGGAVTFSISGLPSDGEWAVTDDQYDAPTNYDRFTQEGSEWVVDWTWATEPDSGGGADGGAFRGITRDDVVRIDPAFNEDARLHGDHYPGEVEAWRALSPDSAGFRWVSLRRDQPVVIRGGTCDDNDSAPSETTPAGTTRNRTASRTARATTQAASTTGRSPPTRRSTTNVVAGESPTTTSTKGQNGFGVAVAVGSLLGRLFYSVTSHDD